jgi:prepilin-type N-terminal cleavage/methylation domain-containing protein
MNRSSNTRRQKGFTLGEIVTTVAIVSTITAIAVPNFLRLRTDSDRELIRQHLRRIGEEMVEIMGKKGMFPSQEEFKGWVTENPIDVPDEVELELTANLSAIDSKDWTTNPLDYVCNKERSQCKFRTCPKKTGQASCFLLEVPEVKVIDRHDGAGMFDYDGPTNTTTGIGQAVDSNYTLLHLLRTGKLSFDEGVSLFGDQMLIAAEHAGFAYASNNFRDGAFSTYFCFSSSPENNAAFQRLLEQTSKQFESQGYEIFFEKQTVEHMRNDEQDPFTYNIPQETSDATLNIYQLSVRVSSPVQTTDELNARVQVISDRYTDNANLWSAILGGHTVLWDTTPNKPVNAKQF